MYSTCYQLENYIHYDTLLFYLPLLDILLYPTGGRAPISPVTELAVYNYNRDELYVLLLKDL